MENIQLKTNEVGYQFHNWDVSALYEETLRTLGVNMTEERVRQDFRH